MKNLNRKIGAFLIVALFMSAFSQVFAQMDEQTMQKFRMEKMNFFNQKLELSDSESEAFWPVYEDMHHRKMKLNEDEGNMLSYYNNNYQNLSAKEVNETINNYLELQKKRLNLDLKYHDKYVELIGEKKTMQMYSLEREYRIHVLKKFRSGQGGPDGPGRHRGPEAQ